jgi:hypothetical protein
MYVAKDTNIIGNRFNRFLAFIEKHKGDIFSPTLSVSNKIPQFVDGRHRFAVFHYLGMKKIPVAVPKDQVDMIKKLF